MVFGRVVSGENIVKIIEGEAVDNKSKPFSDIIIERCGELVLQKIKTVRRKLAEESESESESDSEGTDSEEERKQRKERRKEKKTIKEREKTIKKGKKNEKEN